MLLYVSCFWHKTRAEVQLHFRYRMLYSYQPQIPSPLISLSPLPLGNHKSVVYVYVIFIELTIILFVSLFLCFALTCLNMVILRAGA